MRWRYSLHLTHALGREALARGAPDEALVRALEEREGAARHRARKIEARALALEGDAHLAMDGRRAAREAFCAAIREAEKIEHPRIAWRARLQLAELERREGDARAAAQHEAAARAIVERLAASLDDPELCAALRAAR
jgi:hypothetical protein